MVPDFNAEYKFIYYKAKKEKQKNKEIEESYKVDLCDLEE